MQDSIDREIEKDLAADLRKERANDHSSPPKQPRWGGTPAARSVDEQAARMGISRSYAYLLIKDGKLPSIRLGRRRLVTDADADALLAASREQAA